MHIRENHTTMARGKDSRNTTFRAVFIRAVSKTCFLSRTEQRENRKRVYVY
jgi:hypothetical protein